MGVRESASVRLRQRFDGCPELRPGLRVSGTAWMSGTVFLIGVGNDELADHRIDLARPAQDEGESALDHPRAALAQLIQPRLQARGNGADKAADNKNAADGDQQHHHAQRPALVAGEVARIDGVHQARPRAFNEAKLGGGIARIAAKAGLPQHACCNQYDQQRDQSDPADSRRRFRATGCFRSGSAGGRAK